MNQLKSEDEFKEKQTKGKFKQFLATICLGPISLGAALAWTSPVLPQLENANSTTTFHISVEEGSWVGAMLAIGSLTSAIPAGYLADRFGSKKCIIGFTIPTVIFTLIVLFANDVYALCFARIFSGFAIGGISVAGPMYISEIAQVSLRGTLSSFFELLIYVGVTLTAIFGASVTYITLTCIIGVFTVILGIIFVFMPESPTYLMKMNKREEAEKALRFFRSENFNVGEILDQINEAIIDRAKLKSGNISIRQQLKSKVVIRGLIASVGLTSFQQLSGIDGITFYTVQIFQRADSIINAYTCAIIMASIELLSAMGVMLTVEKADRKHFLYASAIGTGVCLALFGMYFTLKENHVDFYGIDILPFISMFTYNVAFALGLGPVPWMINGELFAPEIKGLASGITIATNWTLLFVVAKTMPMMLFDWPGANYTFFLYSVFMLLCVFFIKYCVPETRGKTLEQIQRDLAHKTT